MGLTFSVVGGWENSRDQESDGYDKERFHGDGVVSLSVIYQQSVSCEPQSIPFTGCVICKKNRCLGSESERILFLIWKLVCPRYRLSNCCYGYCEVPYVIVTSLCVNSPDLLAGMILQQKSTHMVIHLKCDTREAMWSKYIMQFRSWPRQLSWNKKLEILYISRYGFHKTGFPWDIFWYDNNDDGDDDDDDDDDGDNDDRIWI